MKRPINDIIDDIKKYKAYKNGEEEVNNLHEEIHSWNKSKSKRYKLKLARFDQAEIDELNKYTGEVEEELLAAIYLAPKISRKNLIKNLNTIEDSSNPFKEMRKLIDDQSEPHLLEKLSKGYWKIIGKYLDDRSLDHQAFSKKAIGFIKSVGYRGGFSGQTEKQRSWLIDLMKKDKYEVVGSEIFRNEMLLNKDMKADHEIISEFFKCL